MSLLIIKILRWNPISQGSSKSSWRMSMLKDLIKAVSNPVRLSSRTKTEERRMLRKAVSTLFPPDQSASNVKVLDIWNKNVQHILIPLGKARPFLLPWMTPWGWFRWQWWWGNLECLHCYSWSYDRVSEIVDDEEDLVDYKFEKMDDQDDIHIAYEKLYKVFEKHEKLYRLATKKLSDVELDWEELSTRFDEVN